MTAQHLWGSQAASASKVSTLSTTTYHMGSKIKGVLQLQGGGARPSEAEHFKRWGRTLLTGPPSGHVVKDRHVPYSSAREQPRQNVGQGKLAHGAGNFKLCRGDLEQGKLAHGAGNFKLCRGDLEQGKLAHGAGN